MFKSLREAKDAFEQLIRNLGRLAGPKPYSEGPWGLYVRWMLAEGVFPLCLEVKRWDVVPQLIELRCGYYCHVTGMEEGQWYYYCAEAMPPGRVPLHKNSTVFDTWDALEEAVFADVWMYLDGSYRASDVRPRSQVKQ